MNKIGLGFKIEAEELFGALQASKYLKKKGYKILYARKHRAEEEQRSESDGVVLNKKIKIDKIDYYSLCFYTDTKKAGGYKYVHLRIFGTGVISDMHYLVAMGDEKKIEDDLVSVVKEIQANIAKK